MRSSSGWSCASAGSRLTVGRLAEAHPQHKWLATLARALKRWADELARDIAARDRRDPGWRSDPAFYPTQG